MFFALSVTISSCCLQVSGQVFLTQNGALIWMYHLALKDMIPHSLVGHFNIGVKACGIILLPAQLNHVLRLNGGTSSKICHSMQSITLLSLIPRPSVLRSSQPCPPLSQAISCLPTEPKLSAHAPKRALLHYTSMLHHLLNSRPTVPAPHIYNQYWDQARSLCHSTVRMATVMTS